MNYQDKDDRILSALKKKLPGVRTGVSMAQHTTFNIGGPAEYFFIARTDKEIITAVRLTKKLNIPLFVFGGGSNLIVSDEGIRGLVVKIKNTSIVLRRGNIIEAGAGAPMAHLVSFSVDQSLQGLEWAGGLPGTLGGAVRGNAGAFGGETKDSIFQVTALDDQLRVRKFSTAQCQFSYRNSVFKQKGWIILSAKISLKKGDAKELKKIMNSRIAYRKEKHPLEYPNAGSVFKNIDVNAIAQKFQKVFKDKIKQDPFPIVPAAWFIIGAQLAGKTVGKIQISTKHSNYMVNRGGGRAQEIIELAALVVKAIKEKYDIDMEMEIQIIKD